jgi:YrbI family 3-deoxy-D-manno-octulosonate 8-phosphate phosphatase
MPIPHWRSVHTLVFDFDGVFTDNKVWVDQHGQESVRCDRGDGLAFDLLRAFVKKNNWSLEYFILSKEQNPVVLARANKLKIQCHHGIYDKVDIIREYLAKRFSDMKDANSGLIYLGNDLNDLAAMRQAGYSVAPSDAHPVIQSCASLVLAQKGGEGFVRAFIERLLRVDELDVDALAQLF